MLEALKRGEKIKMNVPAEHLDVHFSKFKLNRGLGSLIAKRNTRSEAGVAFTLRWQDESKDSAGGTRDMRMTMRPSMSGLQLKSEVIAALRLGGGFPDFIMLCGGVPFHSRGAIQTHPSFRPDCIVTMRRRRTGEAKPTGLSLIHI